MAEDSTKIIEGNKFPEFVGKVSNEAKLRELLRNLSSTEIRLSSYASKEFIKLLKGDSGNLLLREYVLSSSNCSEPLQAWKLGQGKPGSNYFLSLISTFLAHPDGLYKANDADPQRLVISRALDKLARSILDHNLEDIYKELTSKEAKHQKAALLLLASIVRRGSSLASDVAKNFNFKLPGFIKLAEYKQKIHAPKKKHSTRRSFVGFAMSFLEIGNPRLLRWILQQREMYSAVLRGLGDDDEETVAYILSTLRDRILVPQSLVPPPLRSVLFGSVTLENLINISSRCDGDAATELAHCVLVSVCTDPSNGLMPDLTRHPSPLRGNPKRLVDLMKKLNASDIEYHRELLMAIVKGRPSLGCLYMDEYPYNLEDHASSSWFAAVSLASELISSVGSASPFSFIDSLSEYPPSLNSSEVQCVMKCICPRPFTRLVINKGLLHTNPLVKHGTLKLVLEALKLLDSFMSTMGNKFGSEGQVKESFVSLKKDIQNEVRTLLPDPQVLLSLLSSLSSHYKSLKPGFKRKRGSKTGLQESNYAVKKPKIDDAGEDVDILVSGVGLSPENSLPGDDAEVQERENIDDVNNTDGHMNIISDIWGLHHCSLPDVAADEETYFYSKLLDTLRYYYRTVPTALEGSFDFFKALPSDPLLLPTILQQSLLSLLVEVIGSSTSTRVPSSIPAMLYKHLQPFINMLLYSQSKDIKDQAYVLARAALLSTGAFTRNLREIDIWFLFLPSYSMTNFLVGDEGTEVLRELFSVVITFLCDAVSTVGNNSFKYWDQVKSHTNHLNGLEAASPEFSPLVICVLEKCLRVLHSESGSFNLSEKTMISLYVCNTIKYILQTQVEAGLLSLLIDRLLLEKVEEHCSSADGGHGMCEWRPLMNLLLFSQGAEIQKIGRDSSLEGLGKSFVRILNEVENVLRSGTDSELVKVTKAFVLTLISTPPAVVLQKFPLVMNISRRLFGVPYIMILLIFSLEPNFMGDLSRLWRDMFDVGMQRAAAPEEEFNNCSFFDSTGSAAVAFCLFMRQAPYQLLTPMIFSITSPELFDGPLLTNLLLAKLSDLSSEKTVSLLCLLFFWGYRIRVSCPSKPLPVCESLFKACIALMDQTSKKLFNPTDSDCKSTPVKLLSQCMLEAAEIIYSHPLVLLSVECSLGNDKEFPKGISEMTFGGFLHLTSKEMQYMDYAVLNFLPAVPENILHFFFRHGSLIGIVDSLERYRKSFMSLTGKVLAMFRNRFDAFMRTGDLKPLATALYAFHKLIDIISPHELFELVDWMFSRIGCCDLIVHDSAEYSAMTCGLWITGCAFDTLAAWLQQQTRRKSSCITLWPLVVARFDLLLFEKVYFRVVDVTMQFEMESADICLLKAVNVAKILKVGNDQCIALSLDIPKVILNTPSQLISHFIDKTSRTRAKMLSSLIDISPVHLSIFGHFLSDMMSKSLHLDENGTKGTENNTISADSFLMLLPAAVSYLNSAVLKDDELYRCSRDISSFYCTILLRSFSDWSNFVSGDLFKVEGKDTWPLLADDHFGLISGSVLTHTIVMLRNHFTSNEDALPKPKKRLKLFESVCPKFFNLDHDTREMNDGVTLPLNSVNRIIAGVHFCKMLLFPKMNQIFLEVGPQSHKEDSSRIRFMKTLVGTWDWIVNKFSLSSENFRRKDLVRYLEDFLLCNILELTRAMGKHIVNQQLFIGLVEKLARTALLNRFDDPKTLMMIRRILASVLDKKLHMSVLQLLLAHSQFSPTIHSVQNSHDGSQFGATVKPMASILRLVVIRSADQSVLDEERRHQLEIVKLLRVLCSSVTQQPGFNFSKDVGVNSQELTFLLLSSYGATLQEIDLEIYKLMALLESDKEVDSGIVAEMDFLWGSVSANIRKEQKTLSNEVNDIEAIEERRRTQFREKLPIDPRMCANTVLNFPYYRTVGEETVIDDISENKTESPCWDADKLYDPVYILRFSIHCLSMGYIEPMEFASLGLLAVAFVSISSPDEGMRKLGYEVLGRLKTTLENGQKRKDRMRLRLLLMYIQNGIEESWQRIPSIIALFAAEASCILLDPLHDHYSTISKLLMNSQRVNMKSVPLFQSFLWSSSVTFKSDRQWILRLLYAGLNSDDDCQLYIRNNVIEALLSCYASLLSDNEAKELILQVVKKSLKLRGMASYLVEHCGLVAWLSSIVSVFNGIQFQDQRTLSMTMLVTVLEVVNDVVALEDTLEWLQKFAFEHLSELSTHFYKLLAGGNLFQEQTHILSSILKIVSLTLKISQKREPLQTHFTLSSEAMSLVKETVNKCSDTKCSDTTELGNSLIF